MPPAAMQDSREDRRELRAAVIAAALGMNAAGINVNKSGNVSARCLRGGVAGLIVTPTGLPYAQLVPDDLAFVPLREDGESAAYAQGPRAPSSEWRFHHDLYRARPEFNAIVHTHSCHATALACLSEGIPAFHYMVAAAGGADIRCAPYATFGTAELSAHALTAMEGRKACLLAHHGVIAAGRDLESALALAIEVENLARTYAEVRKLGTPPLLPAAEMERVIAKFANYGQAPLRIG
ncbi:MAG: class II aldolase/adducin family protein [Burkholderiaceae bacterium]